MQLIGSVYRSLEGLFVEMHQLLYFVKLAQVGNFTRAAEACHVSQPTLSHQIAKLEHELGRPLFERLDAVLG